MVNLTESIGLSNIRFDMPYRHVPVAALRERKIHTISLKLPMAMHKEVTALVEAGHYQTVSEFYRAAARALLDSWYQNAG